MVCHINRIIFDITLLIGETKELFLLPCIDIGDERVDPLRDARVAQILWKVDMSDLSLIRSFGEKKEENVSSIYGIATNTMQFLVSRHDKDDFWVEVFDSNGDFLTFTGPPRPKNKYKGIERAGAVATDGHDNIYLLTVSKENPMTTTEISVFDKTNSSERKVFVEPEFEARTFMVKDNHLLVPGRLALCKSSFPLDDELRNGYVLMCDTDGKRIGRFSEKQIGHLEDITADDNGNVMVLNDTNCVYVFALITANNGDDDPGQHPAWYAFFSQNSNLARFLKKFEVAPSARAIAFHWPTGNLVIASSTSTDAGSRSRVFLYSMEGNLERSIDIKLEDTESIQAATVSSDGSICVATNSKVLVL